MKRFIAGVCLAGATFAGGLYIGKVDAAQEKDLKKATTERVEHPLDYMNASRYADWCGGYVQVVPFGKNQDISVQGCDR